MMHNVNNMMKLIFIYQMPYLNTKKMDDSINSKSIIVPRYIIMFIFDKGCWN